MLGRLQAPLRQAADMEATKNLAAVARKAQDLYQQQLQIQKRADEQ